MDNPPENNITAASSTGKQAQPPRQGLAYEKYTLPCRIEHGELFIDVEREGEKGAAGESFVYSRKHGSETAEKMLRATEGYLLFNPVEPINKPKEITTFFLIQFRQTLTVKPREIYEIMVTFPVDIACMFVAGEQDYTVLDIFSLTEPKYSLYGTPKSGLICRYWESRVYPAAPPSPDPLQEGVMRISIRNTTSRWVEVTQAVFSANEMKIYYNQGKAYAETYMKILSDTSAETGFSITPPPLHLNLEKSLELLAARKMIMSEPKLLMEEGL